MKTLLLTSLLLLAGCGTLNQQYVDADRKLYNAIADEYSSYAASGYRFDKDGSVVVVGSADDPEFGKPSLREQEDRELRLRTIRLWQARLVEAEKAIHEGED